MHSSLIYLILVFIASIVAGVMNAIAGGGRFIAFPVLLFAGVPPIVANVTASVGVWPSGVTSGLVYRKSVETPKRTLILLSIASFAGSLLGAWLLLHTPGRIFERMIPPLLIFAATLFSISGPVRRVAERMSIRSEHLMAMAAIGQFTVAIYGGYFGAGMGVLMLSLFSLTLSPNIHSTNGVRSLCATVINTTAVVVFILGHRIDWWFAAAMAAGTTLGGTAGAMGMRRLDPALARRIVLLLVWGMTLAYVIKIGV